MKNKLFLILSLISALKLESSVIARSFRNSSTLTKLLARSLCSAANQWEYKVIHVPYNEGCGWEGHGINSQALNLILNKMGEEGWELITGSRYHIQTSFCNHYDSVLCLKR